MSRCELSTKIIPALFAWLLIIVCTGLYFAFVCRYLTEVYSYAFPIVQGVITLFMVLNLCLSTFMDPGIFPRAPDDEAKDDDFRSPLYKNVEIRGVPTRMKWCTTCQFYRPPRSSHCSSCDNCIDTFDHHCPWLNNCIGRRNYRYFLTFLLTLCVHIFTILAQCVFYIIGHDEDLLQPGPIIVIVIAIVIVLVLFPVFGLTGFHVFLVSKGTTTNEQVTGKFKGGPNPFTRGCIKNCCYVFYGPRWPKLVGYIPKTKTIKIDSNKITYIAADNDVNIGVENSYNGIRHLGKNHLLLGSGEHEDFLDKSSQSFDCEPSPPVIRKHGGSYTNLFNTNGSAQHPLNAGLQVSTHSNHVLEPGSPPTAPSDNTFDQPANKTSFISIQNGGSLGRPKAPTTKEEKEDLELFLQTDGTPYPANSHAANRRVAISNGLSNESSDLDRSFLSNPQSPKNILGLNPPLCSASLPSQHAEGVTSWPPLSPHTPASSRGGVKNARMAPVHSPSPLKDRTKDFHPSRSRESLTGSKECLNQPSALSNYGDLDIPKSLDTREKVSINSSHDQPDGRFYKMLERSRIDGGSPRDFSPSCRARSRIGSRDYISRPGKGDNWSGDPASGRNSSRDRFYKERNSPSYRAGDATDKCLLPRRNSETHSSDRSLSKGVRCPRDVDRSRSFDLDPSPGLYREKDRAGFRDRSMPRNLLEQAQTRSEDSGRFSSDGVFLPQPEIHTVSGYHHTGTVPGCPSGMLMVSTGNTSTFIPTPNAHRSALVHNKPPLPSPSLALANHFGRPFPASNQQQRKGSPTFTPGSVSMKIRDKRIGERLGRQSQLPVAESSRIKHDTYEASV